jgi:hypothetical protein
MSAKFPGDWVRKPRLGHVKLGIRRALDLDPNMPMTTTELVEWTHEPQMMLVEDIGFDCRCPPLLRRGRKVRRRLREMIGPDFHPRSLLTRRSTLQQLNGVAARACFDRR